MVSTQISEAPRTMAPDDIPVAHPATETQRKSNGQVDVTHCRVGPESEVRGGPETPDRPADTGRRQPAGERNKPMCNAGGADPSDPPKPPGTPPQVPEPDAPPPIQEPPRPIPVPPNDPPPPIVAASRRPGLSP
jgi:hypothetical protein